MRVSLPHYQRTYTDNLQHNERWRVKTRVFTTNNPHHSNPNDKSGPMNYPRGTLGTGSAPGLRAVSRKSENKTCTGVFVTRLLPSTTPIQLESFIKSEIGAQVKAEKLPTKYNSYSSFFIRCNGQLRTSLLDGRIWPTGSLVKPYMS